MLYNNKRVEIELDYFLKSVLNYQLPYLIGRTITGILYNVTKIRNSKDRCGLYLC